MNTLFNQVRDSCPSCENGAITTRLVEDEFQYGEGDDAAMLQVTLPLRECKQCGLAYFDEESEEIRHDAVCKHLKILTPREITAIRQRYEMSKVEFAALARVGRISLGRWESGALLQNASSDNLLFLMGFPDNLERLRHRDAAGRPENVERKPTRKFRSLSEEQVLVASRQSDKFSLYSCH